MPHAEAEQMRAEREQERRAERIGDRKQGLVQKEADDLQLDGPVSAADPRVAEHIGVESVCEAAAILATRNGILIVPKESTKNVTVAIARINFLSSE